MARSAMYRLAESIATTSPSQSLDGFVDDVKQFDADKDEDTLALRQANAAVQLAKAMHARNLCISTKSKIVTNSDVVAKIVTRAARANRAPLKRVKVATDLGIDLAQSGRALPKAAARLLKGNQRYYRVKKLHLKKAKRKVYSAAVVPTIGYDAMVHGAAPSKLARIRGAFATCCGQKPGWCTTTLLQVEAPNADPAIEHKTRVVRQFIALCVQKLGMRPGIARAWIEANRKREAADHRYRWRLLRGPMAMTSMVVHDEGWRAPEWDLWIDPTGQHWKLDMDSIDDARQFTMAWRKSVVKMQWNMAAKHHLGLGLQDGADVSVVRTMVRGLRAKGKPMEAQLLLCIAAAGLWAGERAKKAGYVASDRCEFCGEIDNEYHRAWGSCPEISQANLPEVARTQHLLPHALEGSATAPCLWLGGLTPLPNFGNIPGPLNTTSYKTFGCLMPMQLQAHRAMDATGLRFYVDESGGHWAKDPMLRRCGAGVAVFGPRHNDDVDPTACLGGMALTLPGEFKLRPGHASTAFSAFFDAPLGQLKSYQTVPMSSRASMNMAGYISPEEPMVTFGQPLPVKSGFEEKQFW